MIYANFTHYDLPNNLDGFNFPMGEYQPSLTAEKIHDNLLVYFQWPNDLFKLALVMDSWVGQTNYVNYPTPDKKSRTYLKAILYCPYLPYARQDFRRNRGEASSLKVILDYFEDIGIDKLVTCDVHNYHATAHDYSQFLRLKYTDIPQHTFSKKAVEMYNPDFLISPDKGATDKIKLLADIVKLPIVQCYKYRDPSTGKLSGFRTNDSIPKGKGLIVDDICDGGGTFLGLSKLFDNELGLYVTHGGFTKGLQVLFDRFSKIYTTNSLNQTGDPMDHNYRKLNVIDVWHENEYLQS